MFGRVTAGQVFCADAVNRAPPATSKATGAVSGDHNQAFKKRKGRPAHMPCEEVLTLHARF